MLTADAPAWYVDHEGEWKVPTCVSEDNWPRPMEAAGDNSEAYASRTFHKFLDLPPELRDYVYELIASDEQPIAITAISNGKREFPAIGRASRQLREEAVPVFCRTVALRGTAYEMDFSNIMNFVQKLSTASQKALTGNKHLTMFFNFHRDISTARIDMAENNMKLWLDFCQRTGDLHGRCIEWLYAPANIRGPPRRSMRASRETEVKNVTGYDLLRSWYDQLEGGLRCYEKVEFTKMLAALEKLGQPKRVGPFSSSSAGSSV